MSDDFDDYNDVEHGIWTDSDAVRSMRSMMVKAAPGGLHMTRMCEQCGTEVGVEIPWAEMFCVANGLSPQQFNLSRWAYSRRHHVLHPVITCPRCESGPKPCLVFFPMTPHDAQRHLASASRGNVVDAQQRGAISQLEAHIRRVQGQRRG